jgi:hypothetical protein
MKQIIYTTILACFLHGSLFSQVITRRGDSEWIEKQGVIRAKKQIAKFSVPRDIIESKINSLKSNKDINNIIGIEVDVEVDILKMGIIEKVNDTLEILAFEIESANAPFIALIFDNFLIPKGDEMYIYNRKKNILMGPFTDKNNPDGGSYATDIIEDNNLTIEYHRHKKNNSVREHISVSKILHGLNTRLLDNAVEASVTDNDCLVDVNCQEGIGWTDQKNGTCFILKLGDASNPNTSGSPWASAVLINNATNNGIPYIFTAWHNTQGTGSNLSLWIFRFKYWKITCGGAVNTTTISYCGGQMLEEWENDGINNDVSLIKMLETPSNTDGLYYCGWNRSTNTPSSSVLISHPQGGNHLMKISKSNAVSSVGLWWRSDWYVGGATGGSSGGPLFDGNKRIIGAHHGRYTTDCDADALAGKLSFSWNTAGKGGNTIGKWLDPNNLNMTVLDGSYSYCPTTNFTNQIVTTNTSVTSCNINVSNVTVQGGAKLILDATNETTINAGFEVLLGSELEIK